MRLFVGLLVFASFGAHAQTLPIPTTTTTIPDSFFGMTVVNNNAVTPSVKFAMTRSWDTYALSWTQLNSAQNVYNFASLDNWITVNQMRSADMIYTLGRTPKWASSKPNVGTAYGPGQCAPPLKYAKLG